MGQQNLIFFAKYLWCREGKIPVLCKSGSDPQGSFLAAPANHNRRPGLLGALGLAAGLLQLKIFPLECRDFMNEQTVNHFHRLFEAVHALPHGKQVNAVGFGLLFIPAGAQA